MEMNKNSRRNWSETLTPRAVIFEEPGKLCVDTVTLDDPAPEEVTVDIHWSGISTGTERLLWTGDMPAFPGMGYPLIPGYESVGTVVEAGRDSDRKAGETVFVPGAKCYGPIRGLFGGSASRLVVDGSRIIPVDKSLGNRASLIALAATAHHALMDQAGQPALPDLIVGHGIVGRLLARLTLALGGKAPVVWEANQARRDGAAGYQVTNAEADETKSYNRIIDVSGDSDCLNTLIQRMAPRGEILLAGFYSAPLGFNFPPAFMREAKIRIAAEWTQKDLAATNLLINEGQLSLDGLITHSRAADDADAAYRTAFGDPSCLKMVLNWSNAA